ncbi:MAG: hypothetical protein NC342_05895 [Pseudoflavonifractor sp.]|nr:hypothetical protein [Alloprevotella sp.]MCM1117049.1 hypothetical protein [Pseudoflavonifractor sp.]
MTTAIQTPPLPRFTLIASALALVVTFTARTLHLHSAQSTIAGSQKGEIDTAAWNLGVEHSLKFINECCDDDSRGLRLLEIRARESNIRHQMGEETADSYVKGFEEGLRENSDSLANVILQR